jgi:hypothetical protein
MPRRKRYFDPETGLMTSYSYEKEKDIKRAVENSFLDTEPEIDPKYGRKVASIPKILVEKWRNEGFDLFKASSKEIKTKLKQEGYDLFLREKYM